MANEAIVRKQQLRARLAVGNTMFWEWQQRGIIDPPDAWLSPRAPVWRESTANRIVERVLALYSANAPVRAATADALEVRRVNRCAKSLRRRRDAPAIPANAPPEIPEAVT